MDQRSHRLRLMHCSKFTNTAQHPRPMTITLDQSRGNRTLLSRRLRRSAKKKYEPPCELRSTTATNAKDNWEDMSTAHTAAEHVLQGNDQTPPWLWYPRDVQPEARQRTGGMFVLSSKHDRCSEPPTDGPTHVTHAIGSKRRLDPL